MPMKTNPAVPTIQAVPVHSREPIRIRDMASDSSTDVTNIAVTFYENQVPDFVEQELVRLYAHYYSSLGHLISEKKLKYANTYIEHHNGQIISLILFRKIDDVVTVLNEVISFTDCEIERFANFIFRKFPELSLIQFCAIQSGLAQFKYPCLKFNYLEDIVITLPETIEEFLCRIGKNMRRNLRRYEKKLETLYPTSTFNIFKDHQISPQDIHEIVALNRARMSEKNKVSLINDNELKILEEQVRKSGLICTVRIDGRICAGAICFRTGNNYFLTVIAHDSRYDACSLGTLCCTHIIYHCILSEAKEFHFLWGRYDYKYLLGGEQRDLDKVLIFRSWQHLIFHSGDIYRAWVSAKKRLFFLRLHRMKKEKGITSQILNRISALIRRV